MKFLCKTPGKLLRNWRFHIGSKRHESGVEMILLHTGSGNKMRLLNITSLAHDYTRVLLALHGFTSCDTTSTFKGIDKVKPIKLLQKTPRFHTVFEKLGECWDVSDDLHLQ